jgi:hypothetical protein
MRPLRGLPFENSEIFKCRSGVARGAGHAGNLGGQPKLILAACRSLRLTMPFLKDTGRELDGRSGSWLKMKVLEDKHASRGKDS